MILVSLRDLQFRRRRFAVGIAGTALVLGITLVLVGDDHQLRQRGSAVHRTRSTPRPGSCPRGRRGRSSPRPPCRPRSPTRSAPSTGAAAVPIALLFGKIPIGGTPTQVNVHGVPSGHASPAPPLTEGRAVDGPGETVVDDRPRPRHRRHRRARRARACGWWVGPTA